MRQPAKHFVGQWAGYDAPLLNHALEVVMSFDPDMQLTPQTSGLHSAVLGSAAPDLSSVLNGLPKTGAVIAPAGSAPRTAGQVVPYELMRHISLAHGGFMAQARVNNHDVELSLPRLTRPTQIYVTLAALALAHYRGLVLDEITQALADIAPVAGHGYMHEGINSSRIFDESLQAEVEDMRDCLETLKNMPAQRKIAILGTHPEQAHVAGQVADLVLLVGRHMHVGEREAFLAGADVHCFDTAEEVSPWLTSFINPGDLILIKGRKEMGLEAVVKQLTNESI